MSTTWVLVAVALLVVGWYVMFHLGKISSDKAKQLVSEGAKLVDVRSPEEFAEGHLPGAINLPVEQIGDVIDAKVPANTAIVVYCLSGARSSFAARALKSRGRTAVYDLGAMRRW